jgi:hypothetical protein
MSVLKHFSFSVVWKTYGNVSDNENIVRTRCESGTPKYVTIIQATMNRFARRRNKD